MATDPYVYWRKALAWRANPKLPMPDFDPRKPETGFYRGQRNEAVAIWWRNDEQDQPVMCLAMVHAPQRDGSVRIANYDRADIIGDSVFSYCCRHPITHDAYKAFCKSGQWPEDVPVKMTPPQYRAGGSRAREGSREYYAEDRADRVQADSIQSHFDSERASEASAAVNGTGTDRGGIGSEHVEKVNVLEASPETAIDTEITELVSSAELWLTEIGRKITEQTHADRLANYSLAAASLETKAEERRVAEKRPILEAGRAVDARWNPVIERAGKIKANLKTLLTPWLAEQRRKATQEAAAAQAERDAAEARGEAPTLAGAVPSRSVAGTRGKVSLRTQKVYVIDDLRACVAFLVDLNNPPVEFLDGVQTAATKLVKAGFEVPGVSVKVEDTVA